MLPHIAVERCGRSPIYKGLSDLDVALVNLITRRS